MYSVFYTKTGYASKASEGQYLFNVRGTGRGQSDETTGFTAMIES